MGEFQRLGAFGQSQRSRCTMLDPAVPSTSHAPHESSRILAAALRVRAYMLEGHGGLESVILGVNCYDKRGTL